MLLKLIVTLNKCYRKIYSIQKMLSKQVFIANKKCYKKKRTFNDIGCHNIRMNAIKTFLYYSLQAMKTSFCCSVRNKQFPFKKFRN